LLSAGGSYFYPSVSIAPAATSLTSSENVSFNSTLPAGITLSFEANPVKISPTIARSVQMTFNVGQNVSPGDYQVTIGAKSGSSSAVTTFTVHVVQYLVLEQGNLFVPDSLTVKAGSTVYWINLDAPAGGDPEVHNVTFTSGVTTQSPTMTQYATFSNMFSTAGTYKYYCTFHPSSMLGTITVT
jgi:plastocyanin